MSIPQSASQPAQGDRGTFAPSEKAIRALLHEIAPGSEPLTVETLPGSYSNFTHVVDARSRDGASFRIVVRRYQVFGSYDRGEKARREFKAFELVRQHGIPAPEPLYLDEAGAVLGIPGIVTTYVPGSQVESPSDPTSWARALAAMLARIHAVPCDAAARQFLLDANSEASWFLRSATVPDYMRAHPDGEAVWAAARDLWPSLHPVRPTLVHIDYWPGNILWHRGQIAAVVDWEEAAYGDPGIDVAYCRMEMILSGMAHVADEFLRAYERERGQPVANRAFWELAAAARPMFSPEGWITESPAAEAFRRFVADARGRAGY
ncbi:MAG: phosphotransferase [Anaerolineae bacterium]|jgi:aminoglycoside phosphotransferase (APT) family kinase protein